MTLITDVLKRAARQCSVTEPSSWITATTLSHVELRDDFLPETVDEIAERLDLPSPIGKQTTITGDGSEDYALPADFRRITRAPLAVYETANTRRAAVPLATDGQWTHLGQIGSAGAYRYYRIQGYDGNYTIGFYANPASSETITVSYVSTLWMANAAGTAGTEFTDETDVMLLPRRIVELGMVWRFRKRKGFEYGDILGEYESYMGRLENDSRGRRVVDFGDAGNCGRHPMDIPVPDFIPGSSGGSAFGSGFGPGFG